MRFQLRVAVAATLACLGAGAHAQGQPDSIFSLSGFGTVGLVTTDKDGADYVIPGQVRGGNKSTWSGEVDSKLGVQLGAKFNNQFSATVQVLSKQDGDGSFWPDIEWAFAKWQVTPGLALRVGRIGGPFFAVSDFRDVGYANTWLRPPIDVYGQVPVSHFDGADVSWQTSVAGKTLTLQAFGGKASSIVETVKVDVKSLVGVNATLELIDGLSLRLGHATGKLTVNSTAAAGLVAMLRQTPFASVGNELDPTDKRASFSGIGLSYDEGNWVALAEYTKRKTKSFIPDTTGWYTTLGYRVGKFTPYATLSRLKTDDSNVNNIIPPVGQLLPLSVGVDIALAGQSTPQKTIGVGVRWDVMRNVAVKAQFDSIKTTGAGQFYSSSPSPSFVDKRVSVYSLAVDFVF